MEERLSPEERLLRLIRGKRQVEPQKQQRPAPVKPCIVRRGFAPKWWFEKYASFKFINRLLFIFLFISLLYLGLDFIKKKGELVSGVATTGVAATIRDVAAERSSAPDEAKQALPLQPKPVARGLDPAPLKPYSYYSKEFEKRELFNSAGIIEPEGSRGMPNLEENLTNLNLVGIVYAANPQTIIEEKKTNKTYFLNKGDYIGQFKVDQILPRKVILTYDGQVYELNL